MKITNTNNLPTPFVSAVSQEYTFEPNEYRVTSLLKGIRETILERRHSDEIEQDVSDMLWLVLGSAVHGILENAQEKDCEIKEERLKVDINGYILSGQFDLYNGETETITDYKTASVWKIMFANYEDWQRQLLIYGYMLRKIGLNVKHGEIIAMLKDHNKRDSKYKEGYPKFPVERITFNFSDKDFEEIKDWLHKKFSDIEYCESLKDDELPICTMEERYNSGNKYAVMKKGRKTALRVLDSRESAEEWMGSNGGDLIEERLGEDKKCVDYCKAAAFCSYAKERGYV